jgi:hypothetical protein
MTRAVVWVDTVLLLLLLLLLLECLCGMRPWPCAVRETKILCGMKGL